jgi:hypothetical protein
MTADPLASTLAAACFAVLMVYPGIGQHMLARRVAAERRRRPAERRRR